MKLFRKKTGKGKIWLETYKEGEEYITICKKKFQNLSLNGAISELKKIVADLENERLNKK